MNIQKIKKICRPIRVVAGISLIITAVITGNNLFYLGLLPLLIGLTNFCPLCIIRKCDI